MAEWERGALKNLNPEDVESNFRRFSSTSFKLMTRFEQAKMAKPQGVAKNMKANLDKFKDYVPIIGYLCNAGL